ncbi:MAG: hypothetical protein BMS9Abin31_1036 [Gammaproteobacteria bacterium]|nr:MAG: hypothetical protein BMS9Abin31_1036 [Gammaproteobacteria bacterium]
MKILLHIFALSLLVFSMPVFAALEDITIMALGSLDGRAVVKTKDGKMKVLKVGDKVPTSTAVVKQILNDRLVVEEVTTTNGKKQKQTVLMYVPTTAGGKSRLQRLNQSGPKQRFKKPANKSLKLQGSGKRGQTPGFN